jgi:hypothetical protein
MAAFEIDGIDAMYHEGWSVLVRGHCCHVDDEAALVQLERLPLLPWAGENRDDGIRISLDDLTGRRIDHRASN